MLAAYLLCQQIGLSDDDIRHALSTFKLPKGRFEMVYDGDFKVMIDFAHTPHSIRTLLSSLKKDTSGKIIHVFGSAGLRDYKKRPDMGRASAEFADVVILTEEDFRTENIDDINKAVEEGFKEKGFKGYTIVKDRQEAIKHAIELASRNDIVVLTGKSHEKSIARGKTEYPWDEFDAVKKVLPQ
jgi:UDP-N-acetylmuramoyl-L-alanyl-D-glutamate--2,6-diaminopimelate ligase